MSKQIRLNYDGREYILEFTRRTVSEMEKKGFLASEVNDKPMTLLPEFFAGAFLARHRYVKPSVIEDIFDHITNKVELLGKLTDMYNEPIASLLTDPEESEGNAMWTAEW